MTYISKRKPREKQQEALDASAGRKVFAYLMAMRTGKTKVTLDDFGRVEDAGLVDDLFIIAPAGVYETWARAIHEDWPDALIARSRIHVWKSGNYSSQKRRAEFRAFMDWRGGPRVFIMNIEAISMSETACNAALAFCRKRRIYCAIDESTIIKNPSAECSKFCVKELAPLTEYRRILSGLITPKSPLDLYAQFKFLDTNILGYDKYVAFRARYAIIQRKDFGGRIVPVVVGHRDTEQLAAKIAPHSFRVRLEDCYDLPPTTYQIRNVPLTKAQEKAYKELKEFATTQLASGDSVTATVVIAQITRLHQILCGHTTDEEGNFHEIAELRTKTLLDLLEEHDGKAIIWCSYDYNVRKVAEALHKRYDDTLGPNCVARFWGGNRDTREDEEAMFKTDPRCRFMVATASAGGRGRTWDVADLTIYYSSTNDLEKRSQSEERPKAVGKTTSVLNIDLQVPGTVEEKFIYALRNKINLASIINQDNYREWLV